jgi:ribosomal protein S18 acetylase RimI-like enzyme
VSELRPRTPARRPETARPREDSEPVIEPPSAAELERIERHLVSLPLHSGARLVEDPALGALLIRQRGRGPGGNYAAMPRWTAGGWRESLLLVDRTLEGWGEWPSLLVADRLDRPIGLAEAIADQGWSAVLRETVLWVGRASVVPHLDPRMRIEAVKPDRVADHETLERRIFGLPEARADERRAATADALAGGQLRAYVVRVDEEPVAVARLSQGDGVAGIYAVGVEERWRRQGYGALITIVATRAGMALGNRLVWLSVEDGNDAARRVYTRLGFQEAFSWARWLALVE